ncbi:MAG: response regulator [Candidatus Omnitrophica bacterium]|nr:response regulator [Candidatus Omnitrophota bacterium]MCK5179926.1 response regulator [Candidatus Omnitrophota bacterium]
MNLSPKKESILILMADDDEDDRLMAKEALDEARLINKMDFVEDGEDLMDYLYRRGKYEELKDKPLPGLILLDLNMPRKDGREALKEIKADRKLQLIPIVVLTTSKAEEDVLRTYDLGVNSFITKPVTFEGLVEIMKNLAKYWFDIVTLPPEVEER